MARSNIKDRLILQDHDSKSRIPIIVMSSSFSKVVLMLSNIHQDYHHITIGIASGSQYIDECIITSV